MIPARIAVALVLAACSLSSLALAADWSGWRGSQRDGVVRDYTPPATWPAELKRGWQVEVGEGHSSPVVDDGRIIQFSRLDDQEAVSCLNFDGKLLWQKTYNAPYEMNSAARNHGKGPKSTPVVSAGAVYTLGISGILSAWSIADGRQLWQHEFSEQYPKTAPLFGTAMSPLVVEGALLAHVGGHDQGAFCSFDAKTGRQRWAWKEDGPGYTSPIVATLGGTRQLITQSQSACIGLSLAGKTLWTIPYKTAYDQNSVTPIVVADRVVFSGTGRGVTAYRLVDGKPQEAWHTDEVSLYMSSPIVAGGRVYGFSQRNRGQLFALNAESGEILWQGPPRQGDNAAVLLAGDVVLAATTTGALIVCQQAGGEYQELARYQVADSPTWAHAVVVGNRLLIKDFDSLAVWKLPENERP